MGITKIKKRNGKIVKYNINKVSRAVEAAMRSANEYDGEIATKITQAVDDYLHKNFNDDNVPNVEDIQDIVLERIISFQLVKTVQSFIIYRQDRENLRNLKASLGFDDDLDLSSNSLQILSKRYLLRDESGVIIESPSQMFKRIARAVSAPSDYVNSGVYYKLMIGGGSTICFLPNSPTIANAGKEGMCLSACFVLGIDDSIGKTPNCIGETKKRAMIITKAGGGIGYDFSPLRPSGALVKGTGHMSTGPLAFMRTFDSDCEAMKQGGMRRGANMGILRVDHPDVEKFISMKNDNVTLQNFNISVAITDDFMTAVKNEDDFILSHKSSDVTKVVNAKTLWNQIVQNAWRNGDPGLFFVDKANKNNSVPCVGSIKATNPCGEKPMIDFSSCNLGSINLAAIVKNGKINWKMFEKLIRHAIMFLDDVIDANHYPIDATAEMTDRLREVGLGVMGWADMLVEMSIPYASQEALDLLEVVTMFMYYHSKVISSEMAKSKGTFPAYKDSIYDPKSENWGVFLEYTNKYDSDMIEKATKYNCPDLDFSQLIKNVKKYGQRNSWTLTIAPTGTLAMIADCSFGIEPHFSLTFEKQVMDGTRMMYVNEAFEKVLRQYGTTYDQYVHNRGILPENVRKIFETAHDIPYKWHILQQAAAQKWVDSAVSKTINMPESATIDDVEKAYFMAYDHGCKGITIYRDKSKPTQVVYFDKEAKETKKERQDRAFSAGYCPECILQGKTTKIVNREGCKGCSVCDWTACPVS